MRRLYSPFLDYLYRLPNELHTHILSLLTVADILALRRTSRLLNALIAAHAPALVRHWTQHRLGHLHLRLYPAPAPPCSPADFAFVLALRRRHIASIRLTRQLADILIGSDRGLDTTDWTADSVRRQRHLWTSCYERMLPLVFGVGYFLDSHRRVLLERDLGRQRPQRGHIGYLICTTGGIPNAERKIMKKLDAHAPLRLQYFYMYCVIVQVLQSVLRPVPSSSRMEKWLRNQPGPPAGAEDIAFFLLLGGIGQVAKLLACRTYSERRRYLHAYRAHMSPHTSPRCWRRHWRDIGVESPALLDDIPCARIGITALDQIWAPLITQMMGQGQGSRARRDFSEMQRMRYEELMVSKKFINEIMGWDILQGRNVDGSSEDGE